MRFQRIEEILKSNISPLEFLGIVDESHQHAGRAGQESHFQILIVSDFFESKTRVQRQRIVHQLLGDEFEKGLHALSLRLLTAEEYAQQKSKFESPSCEGKSKA